MPDLGTDNAVRLVHPRMKCHETECNDALYHIFNCYVELCCAFMLIAIMLGVTFFIAKCGLLCAIALSVALLFC